MKMRKIGKILGLNIILEANFPEELKEKEILQLNRGEKILTELLRKEFYPTEEEIDKMVREDLNLNNL